MCILKPQSGWMKYNIVISVYVLNDNMNADFKQQHKIEAKKNGAYVCNSACSITILMETAAMIL